jgi:hypothetical protein
MANKSPLAGGKRLEENRQKCKHQAGLREQGSKPAANTIISLWLFLKLNFLNDFPKHVNSVRVPV